MEAAGLGLEAAQKAAQQDAVSPRSGLHRVNDKNVGIGATTHHASSCDELPDDAFVEKSGAGGIRTPVPDSSSHEKSDSCEICEIEVAHIAAQLKSNPHLRKLIGTWSELPEPVRAGIIAMVEAASPRGT